MNNSSNLLSINNLNVVFTTLDKKKIYAISDLSLEIKPKEVLAIVGESGSGKTQVGLSILNLLAKNAEVNGEIIFENKNILTLNKKSLNNIRGSEISMVFQDPMTSINPYLRVSTQITEILTIKHNFTEADARAKAIKLLQSINIPEPEKRIDMYPHQFSGGMRQRIMIAIALINNPKLLIADEPTTALDVTIQAQIIKILKKLKDEIGISIIIISHDLGVVSEIADNIAVLYSGKLLEYGTKEEILNNPKHPYTEALLKSIIKLNHSKSERLFVIKDAPQVITQKPTSHCVFHNRCNYATEICKNSLPEYTTVSDTHKVACFNYNKAEAK